MSNIIKNEKQQLNEFAPVAIPIAKGIGWLAAAAMGGTLAYKYGRLSHEDQRMVEEKEGYFEPSMWVGEDFKIEYFQGNESVFMLMDVPYLEKVSGFKAYEDDNGVYLKQGGGNSGDELRLYLPKKEWFSQFTGKVKTITDAKKGDDKNNTFSLCFYLKTPKNAIRVKTILPDGSEYVGPPKNIYDANTKQWVDDPSRGWDVLNIYKQSGYFKMGGDVFTDIVKTNESHFSKKNLITEVDSDGFEPYVSTDEKMRIDAINEKEQKLKELEEKLSSVSTNPPSGLIEYEWNTYGTKYGGSEFDNWYDSSNGTWITVGFQVLTSILMTPIAAAWAEAWATSKISYNVIKYGVVINAELAVGLWESKYLYDRGMTDQAALVFFCCFLPLLTDTVFVARKIGLPPNYEDMVVDIAYKASTGNMTPAEIKRWMKSLDPIARERIKECMTLVSQYYSKAPTTAIQKQILDGMADAVKKLKSTTEALKTPTKKVLSFDDLKKLSKAERQSWGKSYAQLLSQEAAARNFGTVLKEGKYIGLKNIGLNVFLIGGAMSVIALLGIGTDNKILNDPQKILTDVDGILTIFQKVSTKQTKKLEDQLTALSKSFETSLVSGEREKAVAAAKEYFTLLGQLAFMGENAKNGNLMELREYNKKIEMFLETSLLTAQENYHKAVSESNEKEANEQYNNMKILDVDLSHKQLRVGWDGRPSGYNLPSNGFFSNVDNKTHQITTQNFSDFIYWFSGFDPNGLKTENKTESYFIRKNVSFDTKYSYYVGKQLKERPRYFSPGNYDGLISILKEVMKMNESYPDYKFVSYTNINNNYFYGNHYCMSKIFTEYYDEYLCEIYKICEVETNK
jgi:hypothetical protein